MHVRSQNGKGWKCRQWEGVGRNAGVGKGRVCEGKCGSTVGKGSGGGRQVVYPRGRSRACFARLPVFASLPIFLPPLLPSLPPSPLLLRAGGNVGGVGRRGTFLHMEREKAAGKETGEEKKNEGREAGSGQR